MPQFDIKRLRPRLRVLGVTLARFVALVSLALLFVTHEPKKAESSPPPLKPVLCPKLQTQNLRLKSFSEARAFPYSREKLFCLTAERSSLSTLKKDSLLMK